MPILNLKPQTLPEGYSSRKGKSGRKKNAPSQRGAHIGRIIGKGNKRK